MKHLGFVHILLLFMVAGLFLGPATAELTASQNVPPSANVGENVMVTVVLTYSGSNAAQAIITPGLTPGLETNYPGGQAMDLYPGLSAPISYPIRAVQSGTYLVTSLVSYSEEGTWRNLRLESPFTASGQLEPGQMLPFPGQEMPGVLPQNGNPYGTNPYGINSNATYPYGTNQNATYPNATYPYGTNPYGTNPYGTNSNGSNPGDMPPTSGFGQNEGMPNDSMTDRGQPGQYPTGDADQGSWLNGQ